jgi:hypothetical protein
LTSASSLLSRKEKKKLFPIKVYFFSEHKKEKQQQQNGTTQTITEIKMKTKKAWTFILRFHKKHHKNRELLAAYK